MSKYQTRPVSNDIFLARYASRATPPKGDHTNNHRHDATYMVERMIARIVDVMPDGAPGLYREVLRETAKDLQKLHQKIGKIQ